MKHNPNAIDDIAIGSRNQLLSLWDLNACSSGTPKWVAKNLPNDELDLPIPIWDTDIEWLSRTNQYSVVTCTAYCDVREYDTRGQRKPVIATKVFQLNEKDSYQQRELNLNKII